MADVKIIDIDGFQWEMKDQVARNKIITLETSTQEELDIDNAIVYCTKRNGIATLLVTNKVAINANSNVVLINALPKKYCPVISDYKVALIHNSSDSFCGQVTMKNDGRMLIYNSSSRTIEIKGTFISMTYIAQN